MTHKITVTATIHAQLKKVWNYYTQPTHIVNWNFADPSWHCPSATNDMRTGGTYKARMEAKDGSYGFDFEATYVSINEDENFSYEFGGRLCTVSFESAGTSTLIVVQFDPESENPADMQQAGWQAILNNFKKYTEAN